MTIFRIFTRDLKRLTRNAMALIVAVGVCAIPALYAWFNIAANWDPYGSTAGIKVAVANTDAGHKIDQSMVNVGDEIIKNLKANDQIGWIFVDETEAVEGVRTGKYYAAVVIPPDFSQRMSSILSPDVKQPEIKYYLNEKKNAIAPKITDKGVGVIQQEVNSTFISTATEVIARVLNTTSTELEKQEQMPVNRLVTVLEQTDKDLAGFGSAIDAFAAAADSAGELARTTKLLLPGAGTALTQGSGAADSAMDAIDASRQASRGVTEAVSGVLDTTEKIYSSVSETITDSFRRLADNSDGAAEQLSGVTDQIDSLMAVNSETISILTSLNQKLPIPISGLKDLISRLQDNNAKLKTLREQTEALTKTIRRDGTLPLEAQQQLLRDVKSGRDSMTEIRESFNSSVKPKLNQSADSVYQSLSSLSSLMGTAGTSVDTMGKVLDGVDSSLGSGKRALLNTKAMITNTQERIRDVVSQLKSVQDDERLDKLMEIVKNDPTVMGNFMSSPVVIQTETLYPIKNYGSAMAPFYSILAIWVGGIVLVAILKVRVREDQELNGLRPYQCYLGRYLLFLVLGLIQAAVICLGDIYYLGVQCTNIPLFFLAGLVSSMVFTMIIYTLTVSFGDIGKALCVILLVIQIAGSGGTFPIEVTPQFFQNVYPFLPFTHAINAMRETVAGLYGANYWLDLLKLLCYIPAALLLGLVLRTPLIRLNEFFERRLEDTQLM